MQRLILASSILIALSSCASPHADGGFEPLWSQRTEERGRLPVGHVTAVERVERREVRPITQGTSAGSVPGASISANALGVVSATTSEPAQVYRYTLRMVGGATREAEAEHPFNIGDCVAIRTGASGRTSLVSALARECR